MTIDQNILKQIRTNAPQLGSTLSLGSKSIDGNDARILAGALKSNHTLTELFLDDNSIGDAGVTALAGALKDNRTLTKLDLSNNSIGDTGITALANALEGNKTLTTLYLSNHWIGSAAAAIDLLASVFITSKNIMFLAPTTEELEVHIKQNVTIAKDLIERIWNDPDSLTQDDRKEIQERIPSILNVGEFGLEIPTEQMLKKLADIGIKPAPGPVTQKINEVREAQRQAALHDPSQGI